MVHITCIPSKISLHLELYQQISSSLDFGSGVYVHAISFSTHIGHFISYIDSRFCGIRFEVSRMLIPVCDFQRIYKNSVHESMYMYMILNLLETLQCNLIYCGSTNLFICTVYLFYSPISHCTLFA